jgi:hypothetical protein
LKRKRKKISLEDVRTYCYEMQGEEKSSRRPIEWDENEGFFGVGQARNLVGRCHEVVGFMDMDDGGVREENETMTPVDTGPLIITLLSRVVRDRHHETAAPAGGRGNHGKAKQSMGLPPGHVAHAYARQRRARP